MALLAIETATLTCSVALVSRGKVIAEFTLNHRKMHSQKLMPAISKMMEEVEIVSSDIEGIAVSCGPGSFTGLRIGMTTGKSLAQVWQVPIVGIPTLDALAYNINCNSAIICPILDAQREQVYACLYRKGERLTDYRALSFAELIEELKSYSEETVFVGDAVEKYREAIGENLTDRAVIPPFHLQLPRGAAVGLLGEEKLLHCGGDNLYELTPLYLRKSEAEINFEKKAK
jgi:tRNA threonylcarbamoyladenosine biosynthesis protein TsaB